MTTGNTVCDGLVQYPCYRRTFWAKGLFWVFYYDSGNIKFRTSSDGSIWSDASSCTEVAASGEESWDLFYQSDYVHVVGTYYSSSSTGILYTRGTLYSDGTISWSSQQTAINEGSVYYRYPSICVDISNYVYIGYRRYDGSLNRPYIIKSGNNNGTWGSTPSPFPVQLSTTDDASWHIIPVPYSNGYILAVYSRTSGQVKAKRWNGTSFGSEKSSTNYINIWNSFSATSSG
jgi:hypothetical protein